MNERRGNERSGSGTRVGPQPSRTARAARRSDAHPLCAVYPPRSDPSSNRTGLRGWSNCSGTTLTACTCAIGLGSAARSTTGKAPVPTPLCDHVRGASADALVGVGEATATASAAEPAPAGVDMVRRCGCGCGWATATSWMVRAVRTNGAAVAECTARIAANALICRLEWFGCSSVSLRIRGSTRECEQEQRRADQPRETSSSRGTSHPSPMHTHTDADTCCGSTMSP